MNDGLVQRLQMAVYPDEPKTWELVDIVPNRMERERVFQIVEKLAMMDFTDYGAQQEGGEKSPWFRFSKEAQGLFFEWFTELQTVKLVEEENPAMVEHLGKYRSLMPSLALIFHCVDMADGKPAGPVSKEAALFAACWCEHLEAHARRIYGLVEDIALQGVAVLARKIRTGKLADGFKARDVYKSGWQHLDRETTGSALEELIELGWIRRDTTGSPSSVGGRPTATYLINPKVMSKR